MTPDKKAEKKRWRQHKRILRAAAMAGHFKDSKFSATQGQMQAAARKVVDQIIAGRNPQYAVAKDDPRGEGLVTVF